MKHHGATNVEVSTADCFVRIFDAIGFGTILIGDGGRILKMGRLAEQHLGSGLTVRSGFLTATDTASDRELQDILARYLEGGTQERDALGLHRQELRPLILRVVELTEDMRPTFGGARLIAVLIDPEQCPEPPPGLLHQVFGLTRKEAHVATQIMCGETIQDIAQQAGVGLGTTRAQAKAVLAKTGTNRQAELVGLLTRLAVISHGAA